MLLQDADRTVVSGDQDLAEDEAAEQPGAGPALARRPPPPSVQSRSSREAETLAFTQAGPGQHLLRRPLAVAAGGSGEEGEDEGQRFAQEPPAPVIPMDSVVDGSRGITGTADPRADGMPEASA